MTDREMLEFCLEAFEAAITATTSKAFMKRQSFVHVFYGGTASSRLAKQMQKRLRQHLGIDKDEPTSEELEEAIDQHNRDIAAWDRKD